MKYDCGMTHFHDTILHVAMGMCRRVPEEIDELARESSPAPLRNFLKATFKLSGHDDNFCGKRVSYWCSTTAVEINFDDRLLNNNGDNKLLLSWSQMTKFIRDNLDNILERDTEDEPIVNSTALETLYNTFDESKIDCPYWKTGKTLSYDGIGLNFNCDQLAMHFCDVGDFAEFMEARCNRYFSCPHYTPPKQQPDDPCDDCKHDDNGCYA